MTTEPLDPPCRNSECDYPTNPECLWSCINGGAFDALDFTAGYLLDGCTASDGRGNPS